MDDEKLKYQIGANIAAYRKRAGLTQAGLAEKLNYSDKAVSKVAAKLGDTGRILVRESGTEPVIRVMVEAESKEICEEYVASVVDVIRSKGHIV